MLAAEMIEMARLHPELRTEPGITALEALSLREVRPDTVGLALQALAFALCGDAVSCDAAGLQALRESREDFHPARRADAICALARGWTVCERWDMPLREALHQEYERMFHFGDEPRRIRVGAVYGRFLIEAGEIETAERVLVDCQAASRRLKLPQPHNDLVALGGRLHLAFRRDAEALRTLRSVYGHFERSGQRLRLAETLLPLREAAVAAGDAELLGRSQEVLDRLLTMLPGFALPYAASQVRLYSALGAFDDARGVVENLRGLGKRWRDHVWINELAGRLDHRLDQATHASESVTKKHDPA
jgi:hypothetical protein